MGLSIEQRESERQSINRFIRELNQIRKNNVDRDFANSYVVSNVSALAESFPFVSVSHHRHAMQIPPRLHHCSLSAFRFHFKECLKFQLNWVDLLPVNWTGPIVIRSPSYMRALRDLLLSHTNRVIQNSLLLLFALNALPPGASTPLICTKATVIGRKKNNRSDTSATIGKLVNNVLIKPVRSFFLCNSHRCLSCRRRRLHSSWASLPMKLYVMQ